MARAPLPVEVQPTEDQRVSSFTGISDETGLMAATVPTTAAPPSASNLVQSPSGARPIDARALFLTGLSEHAEFTDLHQIFAPFGKIVLCRVLKDAKTGQSRRVGYVNYEEAESATAAMQSLNGTSGPGGVPLDIRRATRDPMYHASETKRVFIRFIPIGVSATDLRDAFSRFGPIEKVEVERDLSRAARRGTWNLGYVTYTSNRDAIRAVAEAQELIRFGAQPLTVKPAVSDETRRLRAEYRDVHGPLPLKNPDGVGPTYAQASPPTATLLPARQPPVAPPVAVLPPQPAGPPLSHDPHRGVPARTVVTPPAPAGSSSLAPWPPLALADHHHHHYAGGEPGGFVHQRNLPPPPTTSTTVPAQQPLFTAVPPPALVPPPTPYPVVESAHHPQTISYAMSDGGRSISGPVVLMSDGTYAPASVVQPPPPASYDMMAAATEQQVVAPPNVLPPRMGLRSPMGLASDATRPSFHAPQLQLPQQPHAAGLLPQPHVPPTTVPPYTGQQLVPPSSSPSSPPSILQPTAAPALRIARHQALGPQPPSSVAPPQSGSYYTVPHAQQQQQQQQQP